MDYGTCGYASKCTSPDACEWCDYAFDKMEGGKKMKKQYLVTFYYTEGASVIVNANSQKEAETTVYDSLAYAGIENLKKRPRYVTCHREYDIVASTEYSLTTPKTYAEFLDNARKKVKERGK